MLKIPKGLKKKKKGKKSKRKGEEELFTEEELEKYRREHQAQPQQQEAQRDSDQEHSEKEKSDKDEWSKFNALTTGVDSILKKTQGDLDRIKSTSFFQRVPAGPKTVDRCGKDLPFKRDAVKDGQRWIGFEDKKENGEQEHPAQEPKKTPEVSQPQPEFVVSESESEEDEFDDIFDTSYVEAVEKGEVKLAYIPDSPEEEVDEGPDPFDTSYADKIIKGPEVSKKGKKLVNIGVAVEVLTGRLDSAVTQSPASIKKAKRRIPQDLLLESANSDDITDASIEEPINAKSLLDDDSELIEDVPVDLSISLHTQFIKKPDEEAADNNQTDILNAFDTIHRSDDDDDEFAKLASESLSKPVSAEVPDIPVALADPVVDESSWAAFEDSKPKPARPPPPRPTAGPGQIPTANLAASPLSADDDDIDGPDPFDTTFAENILPGKVELKNLEEELLNSNTSLPKSDSDFDFNPREEERAYINNRRKSSVHIHITDPAGIRESISEFEQDVDSFDTLKPVHRDLLGGSSTDLSQLADSPIAPSSTTDKDVLEYSDPFDTSIVNFITAPGKTELKFIEDELLGESDIKRSLSDPDFDPRAEEIEEKFKNSPRKPSRPENLLVNKTVIFKIDGSDLDPEKGNVKKPVTPYYAREASITDEDVDTLEDTFDDIAIPVIESTLKPNQSILKKRFETPQLVRSSSDQDLNSEEDTYNEKAFSQLRRHSDFPVNFSKTKDFSNLERKSKLTKTDFLSISEEEAVDTKVLTPFQESKESFDVETDPFDTSIVHNVLLPGRTELKFLESELLSKEPSSEQSYDPNFDPRAENKPKDVQDLLAPSDDVFQIKALTPEIPEAATGFLIGTEDDDIDPFDTSIADNLAPGKTELKLLETELMN